MEAYSSKLLAYRSRNFSRKSLGASGVQEEGVFPARDGSASDETKYTEILDKLRDEFWAKMKHPQTQNQQDDKLEDYEKIRVIGSGSFGRVVLVKHKNSGKFFAMKVLDKANIVRRKQVEHTLYEKQIIQSLNFPFVVSMIASFKDNSYLYYIMPFLNGGELFFHLKKKKKFPESVTKFFIAQVCLALEYLHHLDLVYRDLKPENILLDYVGYIKIVDFGFCKIVTERTYTFCGTPDYVAPEIIKGKGYGKAVDWWSFGVLIFELAAGYTPFISKRNKELYTKIVQGCFQCPNHFSNDLKDLVRNLLQVDLSRRYGNLRNGVKDIKSHKWFWDYDWVKLFEKSLMSPYPTTVSSEDDLSNFPEGSDISLRIATADLFGGQFKNF